MSILGEGEAVLPTTGSTRSDYGDLLEPRRGLHSDDLSHVDLLLTTGSSWPIALLLYVEDIVRDVRSIATAVLVTLHA